MESSARLRAGLILLVAKSGRAKTIVGTVGRLAGMADMMIDVPSPTRNAATTREKHGGPEIVEVPTTMAVATGE
ncbi:MAG: hypothetical protein M1826_004823 [Phylliscum demangeonii]|nr:MAG: hypothetical protein M1826_004823 [Phylliscum demangeonii]